MQNVREAIVDEAIMIRSILILSVMKNAYETGKLEEREQRMSDDGSRRQVQGDVMLPCPFCGGKPKIYTDGITLIICTDCGISVSNQERSVIKLKGQWNKRTP